MPASLYSGDYARVTPKSMTLFPLSLRAIPREAKSYDLLAYPRA
jgi:hypothetical protein